MGHMSYDSLKAKHKDTLAKLAYETYPSVHVGFKEGSLAGSRRLQQRRHGYSNGPLRRQCPCGVLMALVAGLGATTH